MEHMRQVGVEVILMTCTNLIDAQLIASGLQAPAWTIAAKIAAASWVVLITRPVGCRHCHPSLMLQRMVLGSIRHWYDLAVDRLLIKADQANLGPTDKVFDLDIAYLPTTLRVRYRLTARMACCRS